MYLFCDNYITFDVDKFYRHIQSSEQETFNMAKLLFYYITIILLLLVKRCRSSVCRRRYTNFF